MFCSIKSFRQSVARTSALLAITLGLLLSTHAQASSIQTVPFVDVNRYLGTWYEIASNPQRFSENCVCTRAEYSIRSEGVLNVKNTCRDGDINARLRTANGRAYIQDRQTNSKLRVGFFLPFLPWFRGDYWIIDLAPDYSYAAVSDSDGGSLWILSRTPQMDKETYWEILERVSQQVSVSELQIQRQEGCWE